MAGAQAATNRPIGPPFTHHRRVGCKLKLQCKREAWQSLAHSPVPGFRDAVPRPGLMIATAPSTHSTSASAEPNQVIDIIDK